MAYVIAFAGKGGTGKTTIAAMTVRYLIEKKKKAVLAVDADSNSCLNEALGVEIHATIGKLREESLAAVRSGGERPGGMSMEQLFDYQVQQSVIEAKGFDLMVMGRPEGPGCYCAANNIIRKYTDILAEKYPYVVMDNEAGMEHLSRRTTHKVDLLLVISDPTKKGVQTAQRITGLVDELNLEVDKRKLIINRVSDENFEKIKNSGVDLPFTDIFNIPEDENIFHLDLEGRPVFDLPSGSAAIENAFKILDFCNIP
ncbi:MAG: carbon monoxide dehydrogenase [Nitrospiraceae bacterium]|nr:MAG: carbon monoxide dehydrogenase [Nitrospiraceae bacterium]